MRASCLASGWTILFKLLVAEVYVCPPCQEASGLQSVREWNIPHATAGVVSFCITPVVGERLVSLDFIACDCPHSRFFLFPFARSPVRPPSGEESIGSMCSYMHPLVSIGS